MAKEGLTKAANISTSVREQDFVTVFGDNWDALRTIMGIMRPIRKTPGTKLVSSKATIALQSGDIPEGDEIPFSQATVTPVAYADIEIKKYAKSVSIEAVAKYGAAVAVQKTDAAFLNELQKVVLTDFYDFLKTGTLVDTAESFQAALAKAKGLVINKFQKMRKDVTEVVGFCNTLDFYDYLGNASITVQTAFGLTYVKDFLGYSTLFLLSEPDIPRGKAIAIPVENIDLYYIDPGDSDFAQLGLNYTVQGETNLIGFHAEGDYTRATGATFALMGMKLWAEYIDGIAIVSINDSTLTDVTVAGVSAPIYGYQPSDLQSDIAVTGDAITGTLKYVTTGQLMNPWGPGNFLALKFSNFPAGTTFANTKVGLVPSASGMAPVALDSDTDAAMQITDKDNQKLVVITTSGSKTRTKYYDLSGLVLESAEA